MAGWDELSARLADEFPGWHIWRSNTGRWWATRTGSVLRREDLGTGRVMALDADDETTLREELAVPTRLDSDIKNQLTATADLGPFNSPAYRSK